MKNPFFFFFVLLLFFFSRLYPQQHFFKYNGDYTYFLGAEEPDQNWKNPDFDDSSWKTGAGTIGYGDGDDTTIIQQTGSVYLRITFTIEDTSSFQLGNFFADYDDGYVAFFNGNEIARKNLGKRGEHIPFDRLTDRSHEAKNYRNYYRPCEGTCLSPETLALCKQPGKNVIAVQVHNDSLNGSDLTFRSTLYNLPSEYYNFYNQPFRCRGYVPFDSSRFPIVVLNTDEYQLPAKGLHRVAHMGIINNNAGYNKPTDTYNDYDGRVWIERKGQSSADFPKMSFNFETQDENGSDLHVSLLGLPAESDWVLTGAFADKSLIRNELIYYLGRQLGDYAPRTVFCEVIVNGEYVGLYSLIERIKTGKNRVNVSKLDNRDRFGAEVTGGYLYKYDKDARNGRMIDPDPEKSPVEQNDYINNFIQEYLDVVESPDFDNPVDGYRNYIDTRSLVNYIIINEITKNADAYLYSMYMHKDRNEKLKFGPLWDYDLGFGNCTFQEADRTFGWQYEYNTRMSIQKALADTLLVQALNTRWNELRRGILHTDSLFKLIDTFTDSIEEARIRNYQCWPVIDKEIFSPNYVSVNYGNEIELMKAWIKDRLIWIDENIKNIYYDRPAERVVPLFTQTLSSINISIFPNPVTDLLRIESDNLFDEGALICVYDIQGKLLLMEPINVNTKKHSVSFKSAGLKSGMYFLSISTKKEVLYRSAIIKQ